MDFGFRFLSEYVSIPLVQAVSNLTVLPSGLKDN